MNECCALKFPVNCYLNFCRKQKNKKCQYPFSLYIKKYPRICSNCGNSSIFDIEGHSNNYIQFNLNLKSRLVVL